MSNLAIQVTQDGSSYRHQLQLNGEYVSGLTVVDLVMRVGVASVHMGGIAGVETERAHRKKGYARQVLENSNRWMVAHEYDCAILFGIPDFYDKFGYAVCLPACRVEVHTRDAERAQDSLSARPFVPEDLPAVQEIYAENNADLTGSILRGEGTGWFRKGSWYGDPAEAFVFTDGAGAIRAYAARDRTEERVTVCEVGALQPEYFADIVRWAADRAVELRVEKIRFLIPPDSLFSAYLDQFGAEQTLTFPRNGGGMGRILRLAPFFEKTLPEWTRRAGAVQGLAVGASLRLETDIGALTLRWTGEQVEMNASERASGRVQLPQSRLMQLAMGYYSSVLALRFANVEGEGDLRLFHVLFPRRLAYMWVADHF
ncbi:MAG TPA: GNAT family N-acetyltransferase [Chthonomonadaceae bacterium]|nr:GNAT family N-acetyltransferase [Chthonomonadaceae bacterium]